MMTLFSKITLFGLRTVLLIKNVRFHKNLICFFVFLLSAAFFLADIGEGSITYSDEATHVRVIQEMLASGDYLRPTLDGELYLNKPPLKMWLTLGVIKLIGESNFSFRLIDGLCSAGMVALTFLFACEFFLSQAAGLLASFILLGSFGFFYGGRFNTATQDAFVVFSNTIALWCGYLILRRIKNNAQSNIKVATIGFGLALACGVLSKSIVGLVPLIILLPVFLLDYRLLAKVFQKHFPALILAALLTVLPPAIYFGNVLLSYDDAWGKIFGYDIKARLFTEGFHNPEKWWFYLDRLFVQSEFCAGWLLALALLYQLSRVWRDRSLEQVLLTSWAFLPLFVFSCLQSRAFHYIGPAFPAFALVITAFVLFSFEVVKSERLRSNPVFRLIFLVCLLGSFFTIGHSATKATARMLHAKRKLPVESTVRDLLRISKNLKVGYYNFSNFLEGDAYQRWRQQFYLDILSRNKINISNKSEIEDLSARAQLDVVLTSWSSGVNLLADNLIRDRVCAYAPLWKPEKKRQSMSLNPQRPEAMAILFSDCKANREFQFLSLIDKSVDFDSSVVNVLSGLGRRQSSGRTNFWRLSGQSAAFVLPRDDLFIEFPTKISVSAAIAPGSGSSQLKITINGLDLGTLKIAGGRFRQYSFDVPKQVWNRGQNLVTMHEMSVKDPPGNSGLLLSKVSLGL